MNKSANTCSCWLIIDAHQSRQERCARCLQLNTFTLLLLTDTSHPTVLPWRDTVPMNLIDDIHHPCNHKHSPIVYFVGTMSHCGRPTRSVCDDFLCTTWHPRDTVPMNFFVAYCIQDITKPFATISFMGIVSHHISIPWCLKILHIPMLCTIADHKGTQCPWILQLLIEHEPTASCLQLFIPWAWCPITLIYRCA